MKSTRKCEERNAPEVALVEDPMVFNSTHLENFLTSVAVSSPLRDKNSTLYSDYDFLRKFNQGLTELEHELHAGTAVADFPPIVIVGLPRTGSTYLSQVLISSLHLAYVSNIMAKFFEAPLVGAQMSKLLVSDEDLLKLQFDSHLGRTSQLFGPSEYGWYWLNRIPFLSTNHEQVDESRMVASMRRIQQELGRVMTIYGRPLVVKCAVAPFILDSFLENTDAFIVFIDRDLSEVSSSILKVRATYLESVNDWWSIRPADWESRLQLSPWEQVSWQISTAHSAMLGAFRSHPGRSARVTFPQLLKDPKSVAREVARAYLKFSGFDVSFPARG